MNGTAFFLWQMTIMTDILPFEQDTGYGRSSDNMRTQLMRPIECGQTSEVGNEDVPSVL